MSLTSSILKVLKKAIARKIYLVNIQILSKICKKSQNLSAAQLFLLKGQLKWKFHFLFYCFNMLI